MIINIIIVIVIIYMKISTDIITVYYMCCLYVCTWAAYNFEYL